MSSTSAQALLAQLTLELRREGADTTHLHMLRAELDVIRRPPTLLRRMSAAMQRSARFHWKNLLGELRESKEAFALVGEVLRGREISAEERLQIREQMLDLVKVFPAGLIAAANSAFPVPGTGMFTPWLLLKLGLMPSRWREAHILEQLQQEHRRLREQGRPEAARLTNALREAVMREAELREQAAASAALLTYWDTNQNGRWDEDERAAYLAAVVRLRAALPRQVARKQWFLMHHGVVYGAMRLSEIIGVPSRRCTVADKELLVCFAGKSGWIALADLLGREPAFPAPHVTDEATALALPDLPPHTSATTARRVRRLRRGVFARLMRRPRNGPRAS